MVGSSWTELAPPLLEDREISKLQLFRPFALEIAATLLIHPLLVRVAGIPRAKGARLQGKDWRS